MRYFAFSMVGAYHRKMGLSNEDRIVCTVTADGIGICVVCDGAGGKKAGKDAANILAPKLLDWMAKSFWVQFYSDGDTVKRRLVQQIRQILEKYAAENALDPKELGCTVMIGAIARDGSCQCVNLGDGMILAKSCFGQENRADIISLPARGSVKNSTYLTSSENLFDHIKYYRWKAVAVRKLLLMTDGAAEALIHREADTWEVSTACPMLFKKICAWLWKARPQDDCSCAIITR